MTSQPTRRLYTWVILAVVAALLLGAAVDLAFPGIRTQSVQVSATGTSVEDRSLELVLNAHVSVNGTGALNIVANETNLLDRANNVTTADLWPYPNTTSSPCGNYDHFPLEYAVFQGYYDATNYTSGASLALYDTQYLYPCPTISTPYAYLVFAPLSDAAAAGPDLLSFGNGNILMVSENATVAGYWGGFQSTASFQHFSPGVYTVLVEDEWGNALLLHIMLDQT